MSSRYEHILVERRDGVEKITLNRPDALNAWTGEMGLELVEALRVASDDREVRAIMFAGAGRAFSSGADLKGGRETMPDGSPDLSRRLRESYNQVILDVVRAPKPVIAAVRGAAAGIGCSLALASDFIVASEDAYFLLAFVRIGLIPDGGASYLLPAKIGLSRANRLAMLGEKLDAPTAKEWGLVEDVCADEDLDETASALASRLAAGPTVALGIIKRAMGSVSLDGLADHLELEASLQREQGLTSDFQEGVAAFREKRKAEFEGK